MEPIFFGEGKIISNLFAENVKNAKILHERFDILISRFALYFIYQYVFCLTNEHLNRLELQNIFMSLDLVHRVKP